MMFLGFRKTLVRQILKRRTGSEEYPGIAGITCVPAFAYPCFVKKLAMKYHPDKNPDDAEACTVKFKFIGEAYSVNTEQAISSPTSTSSHPSYFI